MKRVLAYRANRILYNFIKSNGIKGKAIVPANLCNSVVDTLLLAGMSLEVVDISSVSLCVDESTIIEKVRDASVLFYVHTYGIEMDCTRFFSTIRRISPRLIIIDDCCLCLPQLSLETSVADLVLFSTCPKKQVDLGIGGIGYCSDHWYYSEVPVESNSILTNNTWNPNFENIKNRIKESVIHKSVLNSIYKTSLPTHIQLPDKFQNWRFNISVPNKDVILKSLFSMGLFASSHYPSLSNQCPIAINLQKSIINLFNDFYYSEEQAIQTCEVINNILKKEYD